MLKRQADKFENTLKTHLSFAYSMSMNHHHTVKFICPKDSYFLFFYGRKIEIVFEVLSSLKW